MDMLRDVTMESPANSPTVSRRLSLANLASTFVSSNIGPTEAAVIRKAQMNSDLISAFKSACYPGIKPYITGVGLYTHIAGPSKPSTSTQEEILPSQPRFVPIQRPFGSQDSGSKLPEKVRKAWEDLRDIIKVEGEVVGKLKLGLEHLTERYRGLPVPDLSVFLAHSERQDMLMPWARLRACHPGVSGSLRCACSAHHAGTCLPASASLHPAILLRQSAACHDALESQGSMHTSCLQM